MFQLSHKTLFMMKTDWHCRGPSGERQKNVDENETTIIGKEENRFYPPPAPSTFTIKPCEAKPRNGNLLQGFDAKQLTNAWWNKDEVEFLRE